jgi:phosphate butyryltransferase (EC 2.3.1.19)
MNERGEIKGCIVDGPFALDNAVSKESARIKGIKSEVAGDADILLVPDIEAGNVLYKALTFLANAKSAGLIVGARNPIVLTSRADSEEAKLNSIVLATLMAN